MYRLRVINDLAGCEEAWRQVVPEEVVADLWELRHCFQRHFQRPACFIVAEDARGIRGLLPLSWVEESECYGYFPGETWEGTTWLEQNRIPAAGDGMIGALLDCCPSPYHLRYLLPVDSGCAAQSVVDEVGYLFHPPDCGYDIENYFRTFSRRSAKRLKRDLADVEALGVTCRYDDLSDFEHLVRLNVERFGARSYFHDVRFLESFRSVMHFLHGKGWLRMTTVLIRGEPAAVDMGCVYRDTYTLLGGGTHGAYPGVAKLINVHHMRRACAERFRQVDFLCGDFAWKALFHLTPRPLYLLSNLPASARHGVHAEVGSAGRVP